MAAFRSISKPDRVTSTVKGLPLDGSFDLWFIQNQPADGGSTLADSTDPRVKVGSYNVQANSLTLSATLPADSLKGGLPDRAFVVPANQNPVNTFVLTGSATLFDRLLHHQVRLHSTTRVGWSIPPPHLAGH